MASNDTSNTKGNEMTTATMTRKPTFDAKKIQIRQTSGCHWEITDSNKASRCVASIIALGARGFACRIDRGGKPWRYATDIPASTPYGAFEYTRDLGTYQPEWDELHG